MAGYLCIGDLHFGEKGNSDKFNQQVLDFLRWCVDYANDPKNGIDFIVQFGDYFHTRHKIDVSTLNYGIRGAEILSEFGSGNVFVLTGNHDLYYLDRLDVSSVRTLRELVTVVDTETVLDDGDSSVLMTPWVANGEQWDSIVDKSTEIEYLFGHFELNGFKINDGYEMEHGYTPTALKHFKRVITGHYHSSQTKGNITYLGTPYPITMNEANEDHGVFVLNTKTDSLDFVQYDAIKVLSITLDEYLDIADDLDPENTSIRIEFPDDFDDESLIDETREKLTQRGFGEVKIKYTSKKVSEVLSSVVEVEEVENIDQSVVLSIKAMTDIPGIKKDKLNKFYNMAIEKGSEE